MLVGEICLRLFAIFFMYRRGVGIIQGVSSCVHVFVKGVFNVRDPWKVIFYCVFLQCF